MTPTGRQRVQALLAAEIDAGNVEYCYAPYDLPGALNRFLHCNRPVAYLTIDTELWPNTIAACHRHGVDKLLINGRLSARSAAGYARLPGLIHPMLAQLDLLAVQTNQHGERFIALGVSPAKIHVTGSIKFDGELTADHAERAGRVQALLNQHRVILGASTHEGEESALIAAYARIKPDFPDALLVLVPRHTHRTTKVIEICEGAGLQVQTFSTLSEVQDVTSLKALDSAKDVLLVDVMGELEHFYPLAELAFVGGSLVPVGGHNLLEAVRAGVPFVMGSHLHNIDDIAAQFIEAGGMQIVNDEVDLGNYVRKIFSSDEFSKAQVQAASRVLERNRGSLGRVEQLISALLKPGSVG